MPYIGKRGLSFHKNVAGQGLGLSHAIETIKSWGGQLSIQSELMKGTSITLLIKKI